MNTAVSEMICREREFAKYAYDHGIKKAFLTYLIDTSIMFKPHPVPGRSIYEQYPDTFSAMLRWVPQYAYCAQSGDLGFTYGPWQYSKEKDAAPIAYGTYFTVWEKTTRGWFIFIDLGISYNDVNDLNIPCVSADTASAVFKSTIASIDAFESLVATMSHENGYEYASSHFADNEAVFFRDEFIPMKRNTFLTRVNQRSVGEEIIQRGIKIAESMDLYAVYGSIHTITSHTEKASFVRVVQLTHVGWKIAADIRLEYPVTK